MGESLVSLHKKRHAAEKAAAQAGAATETAPQTVSQAEPEKIDESKRWWMLNAAKGVAAITAYSAIPTVLQEGLAHARNLEGVEGKKQLEAVLDAAIEVMQRAAHSPEIVRALNGEGDRLISTVLSAMQSPIDRSLIAGTKYDASIERRRYSVQIVGRVTNGELKVSFRSLQRYSANLESAGYCNGFFLTPDLFVTTQHFFDENLNVAPTSFRDIRVISVPENMRARPEQIIRDDTSLSNAEIHGAFVSIEGIHRGDDTNDEESYPSVAFRVGRKFAERVFAGCPRYEIERNARSFMMVLPPGESVEIGNTKKARTAGMSGAPVWMYRNGDRVLAGIFRSCKAIKDPRTGRTIDVAFFHGIEDVREELAHKKRTGA